RLVIAEKGKDPVSFLQTTEQTQGPIAQVGTDEIAFVAGPNRGNAIAIASLTSGQIVRRIPVDIGPIESLVATADGKTVFFASAGTIWSVPVDGGQPRGVCKGIGVALDLKRQSLIVEVGDGLSRRLLRESLDGQTSREIPLIGSAKPFSESRITGLVGPN